MALPSCSSELRPIATNTTVVRDNPPDALLQVCEDATFNRIVTIRDMVTAHNSLKKSFCDCADRQAALVGWYLNKDLKSKCDV